MDRIIIEPGEKTILTLRKHWIMLLRDTFGTAVVGLLPFVLIPFLPSLIPFFEAEIPIPYITFSTALWLLLVWMALAALWTNYYLDLWVVTTRRIISLDQVGLFHRRVTSWNLEHMQEVSVSVSGPIEALFGYGTLEIETAGPDDPHAGIRGIPDPGSVRVAILKQVGDYHALENANKRQENLLHTLSHEVKGYLTKDEAALAAIAESDAGGRTEVKNIAQSALAAARKGVDTVTGILDSANLKSGTLHITRATFDLRAAVEDVVVEARPEAEKKGLSIFFSGAEPVMYSGDAMKITRLVVKNIIENAVRYTSVGVVRVSVSQSHSSALVTVKDSGIGISNNDMGRLFTAGGKGENSETINPDSTGYGLFVAKQIVDAHGGKIWAESDGEGKGAQFFVSLPLS